MKESIFDSKKRVISIYADSKPPFVIKKYFKRDDLIKEKCVLEQVGMYTFAPKLISVSNKEVKETYIHGKTMSFTNITKQQLRKIANHLKILHSSAITDNIKSAFSNIKQKYDPFIVFKQIECEQEVRASKFRYYHLLLNQVANFSPKREVSLIHSDLNAGNIIVNQWEEIFFIDWVESRIDYPLIDLANLAFQSGIGKMDRRIFLTQYGGVEEEYRDLDTLILLNAFFEYVSPYGNQVYAENVAQNIVSENYG